MRKIIELVTHCDRWHRLFLVQLRRILMYLNVSDLNPIQTLLLYHVGHQSLRVTQVAMGDVCLGSNPSYNLKKMAAGGYLESRILESDRRVLLLTLSPKGLELHHQLHDLFERQISYLENNCVDLRPIDHFLSYGKTLEQILLAPLDQIKTHRAQEMRNAPLSL